MPLHSTEAIVIGGHDLAEADRIIVYYTEAFGKVRAVAEGARRIRSKRFGGNLQLLTEGRLVYFERPNKTLHKVNEFAVIRSHQRLREDLDRLMLGCTAVEAVAAGVEEGEVSSELYRLLAEALQLLEESARPHLLMQGFFLHLLRLLGYLPELSVCVRCRKAVPPRDNAHLSPTQGGILCGGCRSGEADVLPASAAALAFLRGASTSTLRIVDRISIFPQVLQEVSDTLQAFLRHVLGRSLRSAEVLARL
jgi:DNA repair protein RecO (recombination protein O)